MPMKRVIDADLDREFAELEAGRNRVTSVAPAGEGAWIIVYEKKVGRPPKGDETR